MENQTPVNNSGNDQHANDIPNEDEEALMSMLEADSDLEGRNTDCSYHFY